MCNKTEKHSTHETNSVDNSFKGIRFSNLPGDNLCYINSTINSLLSCKSVMTLVNSDLDCEIINKLRYWNNMKGVIHSTETLREMLIRNKLHQFANNIQSDPEELIRCLFDISEPLRNLFLNLKYLPLMNAKNVLI